MLRKGCQSLLARAPANGYLVKFTLADLPQLLLLNEKVLPFSSAGVNRGQIKPERIDNLACQVFDGKALPIWGVLRDDQPHLNEGLQRKPDRALVEPSSAHQVIVRRPDQEPVPILLTPAGNQFREHQP